MLYTLLKTVGGVVFLALLFLGVQLFIRKRTPGISPECDLLEDRVHGCHGCAKEETCALHGHEPPDKPSRPANS